MPAPWNSTKGVAMEKGLLLLLSIHLIFEFSSPLIFPAFPSLCSCNTPFSHCIEVIFLHLSYLTSTLLLCIFSSILLRWTYHFKMLHFYHLCYTTVNFLSISRYARSSMLTFHNSHHPFHSHHLTSIFRNSPSLLRLSFYVQVLSAVLVLNFYTIPWCLSFTSVFTVLSFIICPNDPTVCVFPSVLS